MESGFEAKSNKVGLTLKTIFQTLDTGSLFKSDPRSSYGPLRTLGRVSGRDQSGFLKDEIRDFYSLNVGSE
jgi:hypothetical protein